MPTLSRQTIRQELMQRLYGTEDILVSKTTSIPGATPTTFTDTLLVSTMLTATNLIGAWVYPLADTTGSGDVNHALQGRRISQYNPASGIITFAPAMAGTSVGNVWYELHYAVHPERLNEALAWAVAYGTNFAIAPWTIAAATDDFSATVFVPDKDVIKEGALYRVKAGLVRRASGELKNELQEQVAQHKENFERGLILLGYRRPETFGNKATQMDRTGRI